MVVRLDSLMWAWMWNCIFLCFLSWEVLFFTEIWVFLFFAVIIELSLGWGIQRVGPQVVYPGYLLHSLNVKSHSLTQRALFTTLSLQEAVTRMQILYRLNWKVLTWKITDQYISKWMVLVWLTGNIHQYILLGILSLIVFVFVIHLYDCRHCPLLIDI